MPGDEMMRPLIRGRGEGGMYRHLDASVSVAASTLVGILGTGDFSRSLARRLVASGYQVVVGSRTPKRSAALFPDEAEVMCTVTHTQVQVHTRYVIGVFSPRNYIFTLTLLSRDDNNCVCVCVCLLQILSTSAFVFFITYIILEYRWVTCGVGTV